jgi:hypothetical protein
MKKISILLVGVSMLALVGCGNIQKVKVIRGSYKHQINVIDIQKVKIIHGSYKHQIKVIAKAKIK